MTLHARRCRLLLVLLALAGVAGLAGCTRSDGGGSPRVVSPGMSESSGTPLLFQESRTYVWADDRY